MTASRTHLRQSHAFVVVLLTTLGLTMAPAGAISDAFAHQSPSDSRSAASATHPTAFPWIAYTYQGAVYRVRSNGLHRHRITANVNATDPSLAPGGARVAFLSGPHTDSGTESVLRVASTYGPSRSGSVIHIARRGLELSSLTWSPNGKRLAFLDRSSVWIWNVARRRARLLFPGRQAVTYGPPIWSPDSRDIAVSFPGAPLRNPPAAPLHVILMNILTGRRSSELIRFPSWMSIRVGHMTQSAPGAVIAWLGNRSLLATSYFVGAGNELTGVWMAPPGGGKARPIVGKVKNRRLLIQGPVYGATEALLSADGTRLLVDPGNRLWVAPSTGAPGRFVNLHANPRSLVEQVAWEGRRQVAFVTVRLLAHENGEWFLAKLYSLSLASGRRTMLARVRSPEQDQLEIAPPMRCVGCAG